MFVYDINFQPNCRCAIGPTLPLAFLVLRFYCNWYEFEVRVLSCKVTLFKNKQTLYSQSMESSTDWTSLQQVILLPSSSNSKSLKMENLSRLTSWQGLTLFYMGSEREAIIWKIGKMLPVFLIWILNFVFIYFFNPIVFHN